MFNTLTNADLKGNIVPELAESWTQRDPLTWDFTLRTGVKFHDGTDFDAAAVKFNTDRIMDPATASVYRSELVPAVTSVEVVDAKTVRFHLKDPIVTLPGILSWRSGTMVSPTAVKQYGADFATHPVGTGPFEFVEWTKDQHLALKRFEGYWEKDEAGVQLPYFDTVEYRPITDATALFTALRTGDLAIIETILPADLTKVKSEPNLVSVEGPGTATFVILNHARAPFNNVALRQAVSWGIDTDAIYKGLYFGTGTPMTFFTRPGQWAYDPAGTFYMKDPAKAKAALAAGGQSNGFSFTLLVDNTTITTQVAQAMKAQLSDVGIDMAIMPLASAAHSDRRTSGDFDASLQGASPSPDPDFDIRPQVVTGANRNFGKYSNPKVDALVAEANTTTDQDSRKRAYFDAQALVLADASHAFVHDDADIKVMKTALQGYQPSFEGIMGGLARWWLKS
jgi:peptide/nickel transport system substrate-binding protein